MQPQGDFVLVRRIVEDRVGSIWIPQIQPQGAEPPRRGVVLACGPGDRDKRGDRIPMNVDVGDEILYRRAPANDICIDGQEYTFLHEEQHILAVIECDAPPNITRPAAA